MITYRYTMLYRSMNHTYFTTLYYLSLPLPKDQLAAALSVAGRPCLGVAGEARSTQCGLYV